MGIIFGILCGLALGKLGIKITLMNVLIFLPLILIASTAVDLVMGFN